MCGSFNTIPLGINTILIIPHLSMSCTISCKIQKLCKYDFNTYYNFLNYSRTAIFNHENLKVINKLYEYNSLRLYFIRNDGSMF